jgi:hypothetical protein
MLDFLNDEFSKINIMTVPDEVYLGNLLQEMYARWHQENG